MHDDRDVGRGPTEKAERLAQEVCEGRLSRREFITRAAALGLGVSAIGTLLAACGTTSNSSTTASASPAPMDTTLPKKLYIYNWSDYSSQQVYDDFKKQYGITVVESYYDGNETLNTKLRAGAGGYDVVFPTDKWVSINAKSGLIQPLRHESHPQLRQVRHPAALPEAALRRPRRAGRQEVLRSLHVRHDRHRAPTRQGAERRLRRLLEHQPGIRRGSGRSRCSTSRSSASTPPSCTWGIRPTRPTRARSTPPPTSSSSRSRWCCSTPRRSTSAR